MGETPATDRIGLDVANRAELRAWLLENADRRDGLWMRRYRKGQARYIEMGEIVRELLAHGWVDSSVRRFDEISSLLRISPRNPKSAWSAINKAHVARIRADGSMTPRGEALIAAAKSNGMWGFLDDVEAGIVPDDLAAALDAAGARGTFDGFPRSNRRGILEWIKQAKRAETRATRISETARLAAQGLRVLAPEAKGR
ncbi:MAG: YdeI/OmpD-associated family protein [Pseudomonadota bacterium]